MAKTTKATRATKLKKQASRKKSAPRVKKIMRKAAKKKASAPRKTANRRKHRRRPTPSLWITELSGDYRFVVPAVNISEGGVFLKGRLKTEANAKSQLLIPTHTGEMLEIEAKPVHDMVDAESCGSGYQFVDISQAQSRLLRGFLRNLD